MIKEDYVSFETAKLLKEKGFDEPTLAYAYGDDTINYYSKPRITDALSVEAGRIPLPTLQMAMKWLREVHNWNIVIRKSLTIYGYDIYIESLVASNVIECAFEKTYEQACEAAIKYCLENLI